MISVLFIAVASVPIIWLSRRSLLRPSSHGFFRFFAFEAILALVVLNAPQWFARPLAARQLVSWLFLIASLVLAISGFVLLWRFGKPQPPPQDSPNFTFENTTNLVTAGVYRYIRHPLYASGLFGAWGALLKAVSGPTLLLAVLATLLLVATAKAEETENLAHFGPAYQDYIGRTRLFIPFVL